MSILWEFVQLKCIFLTSLTEMHWNAHTEMVLEWHGACDCATFSANPKPD